MFRQVWIGLATSIGSLGELDLHAFAAADVVSAAEDYLEACRQGGILEVRLVHGRGKGVQRAALRRRLAALDSVEGFVDAPPASGGWGATLVRLASLEKK